MDHPPSSLDRGRRGRGSPGPQILQAYSRFQATGEGLTSDAALSIDGRISISLDIQRDLPDLPRDYAKDVNEPAVDCENYRDPPKMNILIMLVGCRGDVYPLLELGKRLKVDGHRVRVATHSNFRDLVLQSDLEFFNIGGNPRELTSYMLKNPGFVPGLASLTRDNMPLKRAQLKEILEGCWKACFEADSISGQPFAADAIISNPSAFGHIHCAEALGIPLNLTSTLPWSPTTAFPHPLINVRSSNAKRGLTNYLSYTMTDQMSWLGLGEIIDKFRERTLGLSGLSVMEGPGVVDKLKVPWTYCISPSLIPKPDDWKNTIDVVGFYFPSSPTKYSPSKGLEAFISAGPAPIFIGFGPITVEDPRGLTLLIFQALSKTGVRALVATNWGEPVPDNVYIIKEDIPNEWLIDNACAVIHQGDADITTLSAKLGKPTAIISFFGEQPFWGNVIYKSGSGPKPIRFEKLDAHKLIDTINFLISPSALSAVLKIKHQMSGEDGVSNGVSSFYRHLPLKNMRCDLDPSRLAVWWSTEHCLKLSAFAAQTLADALCIDMNKLDLHRPIEYDPFKKYPDPVSGGALAVFWALLNNYPSITQIFSKPVKNMINLPAAIPKGVMDMIVTLNDGLHRNPRYYGSQSPVSGQVTGLRSGLLSGGRSLYGGTVGAATNLFTQTIQGAREEGVKGIIKGTVKGLAGIAVRPLGGAYGAISHPIRGLVLSASKRFSKTSVNWQLQRATRISEGFMQVKLCKDLPEGELARLRILDAFKIATEPENEKMRKGKISKSAKDALDETVEQEAATMEHGSNGPSPLVVSTEKRTSGKAPQGYLNSPSSVVSSDWTSSPGGVSAPSYEDSDDFEPSSCIHPYYLPEDEPPPSYSEPGPSSRPKSLKH